MNNIKSNNNELQINNVKISLKYSIEDIKESDGKFVVLLNIPTRIQLSEYELRNVLCFDNKGNLLWKISNNMPKSIINSSSMPFVGIHLQNGNLKAIDFIGRRFTVDMSNGNLLNYDIVK